MARLTNTPGRIWDRRSACPTSSQGIFLDNSKNNERVLALRRRVFDTYMSGFAPLQQETGIQVPVVPDDSVPGYHMFFLLMPNSGLTPEGSNWAASAPAFMPPSTMCPCIHRWVDGRFSATRWRELPVTDSVSQRLIRLPFHKPADRPSASIG